MRFEQDSAHELAQAYQGGFHRDNKVVANVEIEFAYRPPIDSNLEYRVLWVESIEQAGTESQHCLDQWRVHN